MVIYLLSSMIIFYYYYIYIYPLVMTNSLPWKDPPFLSSVNPGKPSINGPFSMAMLNNQRVYIYHNNINNNR